MNHKKFKLLALYTGGFWKNAVMKNYAHQDAVLKYLNREVPLDIILGVPMRGATYFAELLQGKDSRVQTPWRELPYRISDKLNMEDFDGLLLELAAFFGDIELPNGKVITGDEINSYIEERVRYAMSTGKPIVMFDPDGYSYEGLSLKDKDNQLKYIFNICKDYDKFTLIHPFEFMMDKHTCNQAFMPYNVDPETLSDEIYPKSKREYLSRYVGNNFFRDNFVPYFKELCKYGTVEVYGKWWKPHMESNPEITWGSKFAFTQERVYPFYKESLVGLYGTVPKLSEMGHYTLRVREFMQAGMFIIPECDYMKDKFIVDEFPFTMEDIFSAGAMHDLMNMSDEEYERLVLKQRKKLLEFFSAENYVHIYRKALGV